MPHKRPGAILVGIGAVLYISACLLLHWGQTRLIFLPDRLIRSTPQKYGLDYQDVWIDVNQEKIHGWWVPSGKKSAPVLLYFHGNASNNGDLTDMAAIFHQLRLTVLLVDYRGYGKSSPTFPSENKLYEDAVASWKYLTQERQIKPQNIFVYGHSLGGAIAIDLATKYPEMAGLITEGTFTSVKNMARTSKFLRVFPLDLIVTQRFDSIKKIKSLNTPLLILHGTGDETVPVFMAGELYAAATEPKQLVIFPQAGHTNLQEVEREKFLKSLEQFIQLNILN